MNKITQVMTNLIGSEVCGDGINSALYATLTEEECVDLYRLSKKHDLAHLVGNALITNDLIEEGELKETYRQELCTAVYRYEQIAYELNVIKKILTEDKIPYIPLKGSVIRKYYPEPWMRTSCDIDVLVHEKDLEKAVKALEEKGEYTCERYEKGSHDIQMYSSTGVHVELHYTLIENDVLPDANKVLSCIWEYTAEEKGDYTKTISYEAFYFYHIAHMVKHFINGGCGIKPFVDLWVLNHSEKIQYDIEKRKELLLKGGLLKFSEEAEKLSEVWFGEAQHTETTRKMEEYVLQGGVYGTMQNRVALQQVKKGGKCRYAMSRIWLPYETLKYQYPVLKKHKWLMPFCEVRRWFKLLFKGGARRGFNELSANSRTSKAEQNAAKSLLAELGLNE